MNQKKKTKTNNNNNKKTWIKKKKKNSMRSKKRKRKNQKTEKLKTKGNLKKNNNNKLQINAFVCFIKYHMNNLMIFCSGISPLVWNFYEKAKEKNINTVWNVHGWSRGFFGHSFLFKFPLHFSPIFGENISVGLEKKHLGFTNFPSIKSTQPNTPLNFFPPNFLSILPKIHQTKQTFSFILGVLDTLNRDYIHCYRRDIFKDVEFHN